jgi:hypothetical protein
VREYERSLRLHILPILGGARLSRIQRRDIQRLADDLLASGADPSTMAGTRSSRSRSSTDARSRIATSP